MWVCSLLDNSVSVYSMPGLHRLGTIPVGKGPDWLTFTPDSSRCYVSNAALIPYRQLMLNRVRKLRASLSEKCRSGSSP